MMRHSNFISLILNFHLIGGRYFANRLAKLIKHGRVSLGTEEKGTIHYHR